MGLLLKGVGQANGLVLVFKILEAPTCLKWPFDAGGVDFGADEERLGRTIGFLTLTPKLLHRRGPIPYGTAVRRHPRDKPSAK